MYATGTDTYFGKTAQMVQEPDTVSHFQRAVLKIGDYLISWPWYVFFWSRCSGRSIPVAMPTVLSVTMAVGAALWRKNKPLSRGSLLSKNWPA